MDILEKIFGSAAKVKIMRLFLFNPDAPFDLDKTTVRAKITPQAARLNIRMLEQAGLLKSKVFVKTEKVKIGGSNGKVNGNGKGGKKGKKGKRKNKKADKATMPVRIVMMKKRVRGWILNETFPYLDALQSFLVQASPLQDQTITRKFNRAGKIKLLIISGVFLQEKESRVDVLVVGDELRKGTIDSIVKDMEAELGKDIVYAMFETKDFQYRLGMYDKLIRDILDYPHRKLVNKLGM
jgi:hypothetical protein